MTQETDTTTPEQETPKARASVVPGGYKATYAARGNADHCGDWLAGTLNGRFEVAIQDENGKTRKAFDTEAFTTVLEQNEVPMTGKWASLPTSGQKGWVGRYRMNGRQQLQKRVLAQGFLRIGRKKLEADHDWLVWMASKHPKVETEWNVIS